MPDSQLAVAASEAVRMIYLGHDIGGGKVVGGADTIDVDVSFNWPPEAIAEVGGHFHLKILSDETCAVAASFPGLVDPLKDGDASYYVLLIGARPQFYITTHAGDRLFWSSTGPFSQPEIVTGYELGIQPANGHAVNFKFPIAVAG
jgi:hypothetical protein